MTSGLPPRGLTLPAGFSAMRFPTYQGNLLLDDFTGSTQAYGLRQLRNGYRGPLVRVMRASDGVYQNIGFDSDGEFDSAAFSTFIGASTGHLHVWYDQSGNQRHAVQKTLTTTAQFQIVAASALNSKPCVRGTGTHSIDGPTTTQFPSKRGTLGAVYDVTGSVGLKNMAQTLSTDTPYWIWYAQTITDNRKFFDGTANRSIAGFAGAALNIETLSRSADTSMVYRNNGAATETLTLADTQQANSLIRLGGQTAQFIGDIYEFYVWPTGFDTSSLHTAINNHFAGY